MKQVLSYDYEQQPYNPKMLNRLMRTNHVVGPWEPIRQISYNTEPLIENKRVEKFLSTIIDRRHTKNTEMKQSKRDTIDNFERMENKSEKMLIQPKYLKSSARRNSTNSVKQMRRQLLNKIVLKQPIILPQPKLRSRSTAKHVQSVHIVQNNICQQQEISQPSLPRFNMLRGVLKGQKQKKKNRVDRSLFYLGSATKTNFHKVGQVGMKVRKLKDTRQSAPHFVYSHPFLQQKLARLKQRKDQDFYHNISHY